MKVGTDAILLGIWCNIDNAETILDIGTGSGIIALLMAARSKARVDAVELDEKSAIEAEGNFRRSPNSKQLNIYNVDFNEFAWSTKQKYDVIISNPPFFSDDLLPDNLSRKAARHVNKLSHNNICEGISKLLSKNGKFSLVLPQNQSLDFIITANKYNLNLYKQQLIFPAPNTNPNRINMEFRFEKTSKVIVESMVIRRESRQHTKQYKEYVSDYLTSI